MTTIRWTVALVAAIAGGCTRKNPSFCCLTEADCAAEGVDDGTRPCGDGLACVDNSCVAPMCATAGCGPDAPVCETTTGLCTGCATATDCERFAGTPLCDSDGEATCVQCLSDEECDATTPICDGNACRVAMSDAECPSGAVGPDGMCVDETKIIYMAPQGASSGDCGRDNPCRDPRYAYRLMTNERNHVVFAPGTYGTEGAFMPRNLQATFIHGNGAELSGGTSDVYTMFIYSPATVTGLTIRNINGGHALYVDATTTLRDITAIGDTAIRSLGVLTASNVTLDAFSYGIDSSGSLTIDGGRIIRGRYGLHANGVLDITNLVITGTNIAGVWLSDGARGVIRFSTIGRSGMDSSAGTDAFGIICAASRNVSIENSIVWSLQHSTRVPISGCHVDNIVNSIAGPVAVPGAMNTSPRFVSEATGDIHLDVGSPARDAADAGPTHDFEGDPRPKGVRFDLGADEAL